MPQVTQFSLPTDDFAPLATAFDKIGKYRFGPEWSANMAATVRLGKRSRDPDQRAKGQWTLRALTQCVENGWLPLVYFKGTKRVRYFDASEGPALRALYPQPTDDQGGQVELEDEGIYPCMVDTSGLARILREKFGKPKLSTRGRPRRYVEIGRVLDEYFKSHPPATPNMVVIKDVGGLVPKAELPGDTVLHERVNDARDRAITRMRSAN